MVFKTKDGKKGYHIFLNEKTAEKAKKIMKEKGFYKSGLLNSLLTQWIKEQEIENKNKEESS